MGQASLAADGRLEALEEQAFKQAAALVDPSLVRIETVGGLEQVGEVTLGTGPTSGLVVSENGFVISSSFNFVSKPASILVTLADGRRFPAKLIASDKLKLLTLLKIEATGLTPARPASREAVKVGQWAIALGRTFDLTTPSISVGIVSATNRIWGKAIQTDAKTSPVNYGGALVDVEGRVLGVIAPLSPMGNGETAGVEWYDGGIGFAIPLEDVYGSLDRLKQGKDLLPGLLGITFAGGPSTNVPVVVDRVRYNSPAQQAGLKTNDRIVEANGEKIARVAQLKHVLGRLYGGDSIKLTIQRDDKSLAIEPALAGELVPYEVPFLGLLPKRAASAEPGMVVRFVFPDSPAEKSGLLRGDRVVKFNGSPVENARGLSDLVGRSRPGDKAQVTSVRDGRETTVEVTLATLPDSIVGELSAEVIESPGEAAADVDKTPADAAKAGDAKPAEDDSPAKGPKTGRFTEELAGHDHGFWAYVPENYNASHAYGLMVWIHPGGDTMEATISKQWKSLCDRRGIILVAPKADSPANWTPGEAKFVEGLVAHVREKYTIDAQRIFLHSYGSGTQLACLLATKQREVFRGLSLAGAPFAGQVADQEPDFKQQFHFVCGDGDKALPAVKKTVEALKKLKFPVSFTMVKGLGAKYPSETEVDEIGRWADCLDRI
ncbi:MAG: PDZ domain-containing protein [Planctomycetota bacterium]